MRLRTFLLLAAGLLLHSSAPSAHARALLELKVKNQTYQGRLVTADDDICWLIGRDGRLMSVELNKVRKHRAVSPRFRRFSTAELRDELRHEFGAQYEIIGTSHYLVVAKRGAAKQYADLFEDIFRSFYTYFSVRGPKIHQPEFPLVAIVFPDHLSFAQYCRKDGIRASSGLLGYYLFTSNRVALYDPGTDEISMNDLHQSSSESTADWTRRFENPTATVRLPLSRSQRTRLPEFAASSGSTPSGLRDTIVHETTHQVAFNTGLHSRIGESPRWVIEGLATVFESPGIRDATYGAPAKTRINRERYVWFGNYRKQRRKDNSLAAFVRSDRSFETSILDAYSQAWALSFFLVETRPSKYAKYLTAIADRDPLKPYSAAQRLEDFTAAFGRDLRSLEDEFLRFIDRLQ